MQQSDWVEGGQGWQGKEITLRLQGWSRQRRFILLRIGTNRGDMLSGVSGIVLHDHWDLTSRCLSSSMRCATHHSRELQALVEIEKEGWAKLAKVPSAQPMEWQMRVGGCKSCCAAPVMSSIWHATARRSLIGA
jgi:hypothetical protein